MDQPVIDKKTLGPAIVDIHTINNKKYPIRVEDFKGNPGNPMSREDCIEKFKRCSEHIDSPISEEKLKECINKVYHLDELDNVTVIMKLLSEQREIDFGYHKK